jgi:two-component system sensor histidine kinase CpxA
VKPRLPLSSRILLLAFLNVALLVTVFAIFARVQYRFELSSFLLAPARDRMFAVSRLIALDLPQTPRSSWNALLARYSATYPAQFYLFASDGSQVAGPPVTPPPAMMESIRNDQGPPPEERGPHRPHDHGPHPHDHGYFAAFMLQTHPGQYWVGVHVPIFSGSPGPPAHGTLVWMFSSLWTNPFFFDYRPWFTVILAVIVVSIVCWLPLIRGLTRSITQLTGAAERIAEGDFAVPVSIARRDELGQLGNAIRSMAHRLSGYVQGQKRFLGDIAHELCSPISRIQVSLGILEQRAAPGQAEYIEGLHEEIEHMSGLVNELLSFSRAQVNANTPLTRVNVADTVARVLERETPGPATVETRVPRDLEVMAHPEYLFRSLSNLVRNALRYAAEGGPIVVAAHNRDEAVSISVVDQGPGLPEAELDQVFRPFYRPEFARQRETGGTGLGLAIVKSCIEACGGSVACRNRSPHGLEVEIRLAAADA